MLTLEEIGGLVGNQVARKVLRRIDQTGNESSAQIGALEEVEEGRRTTGLLFNLDGTFDHGKRLVGLVLGLRAESLDGAKGFVFAAATNEPPG